MVNPYASTSDARSSISGILVTHVVRYVSTILVMGSVDVNDPYDVVRSRPLR